MQKTKGFKQTRGLQLLTKTLLNLFCTNQKQDFFPSGTQWLAYFETQIFTLRKFVVHQIRKASKKLLLHAVGNLKSFFFFKVKRLLVRKLAEHFKEHEGSFACGEIKRILIFFEKDF